jgi:uncharacterized membrane protein YbhN (UPF0104 family)
MRAWLRKWWPVLKTLLAVAIVLAVGRQLARDLQRPELWRRPLSPGWMALSGGLYILGLGMSALFWFRLLRALGQRPAPAVAVRAYYLGHLGKYLPGKAWALMMRATLAHGPGVRIGAAGLTAFYEVLTTMASGVLLAAVVFALLAADTGSAMDWDTFRGLLRMQAPESAVLDRRVLVLLALLLLVPVGLPIMPAVFNRLVGRLAARFREPDAPPVAHVPVSCLGEGLALTTGGWLLLGGSLWAMLHAVCVEPPAGTADVWLRYTAILSLAYVAGFIILLVPSGLGVREFFLTLLLIPEVHQLGEQEADARAVAVLAVLLLRLVWTGAELATAGIVYWLPAPAVNDGPPAVPDHGPPP